MTDEPIKTDEAPAAVEIPEVEGLPIGVPLPAFCYDLPKTTLDENGESTPDVGIRVDVDPNGLLMVRPEGVGEVTERIIGVLVTPCAAIIRLGMGLAALPNAGVDPKDADKLIAALNRGLTMLGRQISAAAMQIVMKNSIIVPDNPAEVLGADAK